MNVTRRLIRRAFVGSMRLLDKFERGGPERVDPSAGRAAEIHAKFEQLQAATNGERVYLRQHGTRIAHTLALVERVAERGEAIELGSYLHMAWLLEKVLGYREVHCAGFGPPGTSVTKSLCWDKEDTYTKEVDLFDVEGDAFPYPDGSVDLVLACELIEHLRNDPLRMLREIHRVLRMGGVLVLTTPNCSSLTSLANILYQVSNPYVYSQYPPPGSAVAGHVREYVPAEMRLLLQHAGLDVTEEFTLPVGDSQREHFAIRSMLATWGLPLGMRGELYFAAARKGGRPPAVGYPRSLFET